VENLVVGGEIGVSGVGTLEALEEQVPIDVSQRECQGCCCCCFCSRNGERPLDRGDTFLL
jgi:hypothetical protein